jgi:lysophospholipase L1-like esterase
MLFEVLECAILACRPCLLPESSRPMNSFSGLIVVLGSLLANSALAQPNSSSLTNSAALQPHSNRCIIPVAREGKWTNRFELLNQRVKEAGDKAEVLFVGDSITQGWEGSGKEVWEHYYAPRHAVNIGISGDRTEHVLWRLDHGNVDTLKPKVAVLLIGVNNIPDEKNSTADILEGVKEVAQKLEDKLPNTKILLLGIFPFRKDFDPLRGKALEIDQALHRWADGERVTFLDFGYKLIEPDGTISKSIMPDALHPNKAGYEIWAKAMEPTLARLLGQKPLTSP